MYCIEFDFSMYIHIYIYLKPGLDDNRSCALIWCDHKTLVVTSIALAVLLGELVQL